MNNDDFIDIESTPEEETLDALKRRGLIPAFKKLEDLTNAERSILDIELKRQERKSNPLENFTFIREQYLECTKQRRIEKVSDFYERKRGGDK